MKLHLEFKNADWTTFENEGRSIADLGVSSWANPWVLLALQDNAFNQRLRSENWTKRQSPMSKSNDFKAPKKKPEKLRVGYFSADFHNFAGMFLMAGLLEQHNRTI